MMDSNASTHKIALQDMSHDDLVRAISQLGTELAAVNAKLKEAEERKLTKPAMIGGTQFGVGVSERLVVGRAQREYEYRITNREKEVNLGRANAELHLELVDAHARAEAAEGKLKEANERLTQVTSDRDAKTKRMWELGHQLDVAEAARAEERERAAKRLVEFDIAASVDDYEFRGDDGCYTPNERETILMIDYAHGLIYELIEAIRALPDTGTQAKSEAVKPK